MLSTMPISASCITRAVPPKLKKGDYLVNGHTHIPANEDKGDFIYINPGSVSIPKAGNGHTYMIYENGEFALKEL